MRSPFGAVNRMEKRLGRIWYSRPRVVSGVPIIGFVMIWTKSAERLVIVWYVALARSRIGQGSGDWSAREMLIARNAERGTRNAEHAYQRWLGCSAFRLPRSAFSVLTPPPAPAPRRAARSPRRSRGSPASAERTGRGTGSALRPTGPARGWGAPRQ